MQEQHPLSPEERRKRLAAETAAFGHAVAERIHKPPSAWEVVKRVAIGVYNDGFIHAGNLAYLAVVSIFPFFITGAALFSLIGEESSRAASINRGSACAYFPCHRSSSACERRPRGCSPGAADISANTFDASSARPACTSAKPYS